MLGADPLNLSFYQTKITLRLLLLKPTAVPKPCIDIEEIGTSADQTLSADVQPFLETKKLF